MYLSVPRLLKEQWNSSNPDTNGAEESVLISVVSLFQGLNCLQDLFLGKERKVVLIREVSSFQGCP